MPTQRVWYWYGIKMPQSDIIQFEPTANWNPSEHNEMPGSDFGPQFAGVIQATPDITFVTRQLKDLWDQTPTESVCGGIGDNADGVKLWQRSSQPFGLRAANNDPNNRLIEISTQCLLCWESLQADQGSPATVNGRLNVAYDGTNEPFLWTGEAEDIPTSDPATTPQLWTLGPVDWTPQDRATPAAARMGGVTSVRWENNLNREEQYSDGDAFPTYQGIRDMSPVITITTTDQAILNIFDDTQAPDNRRGVEVHDLRVRLRRLSEVQIHYPDAGDAQIAEPHIELHVPTSICYPQNVTAHPNEMTLQFRANKTRTSSLFTIDTDTTIPAPP